MKKIFLSLFLLFGAVNSSFAVEIPDVMRKTMAQDPIGATGILQLVISMAFVIGLIYVTGWIYTKLNIVNRQKLDKINKDNSNGSRFTVLQSMSLGQQRHLYSIEMNNKVFLVASTPSHINVLKEFDKELCTDKQDIIVENEVPVKQENVRTNIDIDELYKKYKN